MSRILIGEKGLRGQTIGEHIVRKMVDLMFEDAKVDEVDLNVFEWNKGALNCYKKVGFRNKNTMEMIVNGKNWTKLNLNLLRKNHFSN